MRVDSKAWKEKKGQPAVIWRRQASTSGPKGFDIDFYEYDSIDGNLNKLNILAFCCFMYSEPAAIHSSGRISVYRVL